MGNVGKVWLAALAALVMAGVSRRAVAGEDEKPKYVGVAACSKLCHEKASQGRQAAIWKDSKHAKAYETLLTDAAKAVGKKVGVEAPEKSPKCLKCHVTGFDAPKDQFEEAFRVEDGVQCESCHGPGERYKGMATMKNRSKALANGLIIGDVKTCLQCHNDTAPSWDPNRYTTRDGKKVGFDYEPLWAKIVHPKPKDEAKE
jgi:hypothetical protein